MATLNSALHKQVVASKRTHIIARALLLRRLNQLLGAMGRALNTSAMVRTK